MNKEFIPYEEALALKELGFDENCFSYYFVDGHFSHAVQTDEERYPGDNRFLDHRNSFLEEQQECSAPLYQQAFRFFREKYQIDCWIEKEPNGPYSPIIWSEKTDKKLWIDLGEFDSYKDAQLACLKKLIEIVEIVKEQTK